MAITVLIPLLSSILVFFLGAFVLWKGKSEKVNILFSLLSMAITVWMFGTFMMFLSRGDIAKIIFWDKIVYIGVVFIPIFSLHYGFSMTRDYSKRGKILLVIGYILSSFFLILIPSEIFLSEVFIYKWGAHTRAQLFHHIFLLYFISYIGLMFFYVYRYYQSAISAIEKEKIKYCFMAFGCLATIGSLGFLPAYGISIYPFAYISGVIFTIIIAYSIIFHRLMDIDLIMRRYSVYLSSFFLILLASFGLRQLSYKSFPAHTSLIDPLILVLAIIAYPFIKAYSFRIANRYFFTSLYDSRKVIAAVSDRLRSTLEISKIYDIVHETLESAFYMKSFAVLTLNEEDGSYAVKYNKGFNFGKEKKLSASNILRDIFKNRDETIFLEEIKSITAKGQSKMIAYLLENLGVDIITPLNIKDKTVGLILFGQKKSGDIYNEEDLAVLRTVSTQLAIATENALLYQETLDFSLTLTAEVERKTADLERKTADLREANEELKKLDQAKSEFLHIASHQLRTPVSVIKGIASMMMDGDLEKLESEKRKDFYVAIMAKSRKLEMIIHDILNATSLTANKYSVMDKEAEAVDLRELISYVIKDFFLEIEERGLSVNLLPGKEDVPLIRGQKEYLKEVFINLINNAIKYTPSSTQTNEVRGRRDEQGTIEVEIENDKDNKGNVLVKVSDNGIGIPPDEIPKLFKKFSRAKNAVNMYTDGSGIGLFVVKEIIEGHSGKVWLESELGKGTTFYVSLPVFAGKKIDMKEYIMNKEVEVGN